jgi:hypothetical protein
MNEHERIAPPEPSLVEIPLPPRYKYSALLPSPNSIRLLRLLSATSTDAPIECQLFDYSLSTPKRSFHIYECLSYVWGSPEDKKTIFIDGARLDVTSNLYASLRRLRDPELTRTIWIDAICINQEDLKERSEQVRFMAKIYAYARQVLAWLGEEADGSNEVMEQIRAEADQRIRSQSHSSILNQTDTGVSDISMRLFLTRPWFRRIWVLQEIAAARSISFICGARELSGSCFYHGLQAFERDEKSRLHGQNTISSIAYLLSGAALHFSHGDGGAEFQLGLRPLSELVDMFRMREATDSRDKIYALLGMSSPQDSEADIIPDYKKDWISLMRTFFKNTIGATAELSRLSYSGRDILFILSFGWTLGRINIASEASHGRQTFTLLSHRRPVTGVPIIEWIVHASAIPVRPNDIVCLLEGARKLTIIRYQGDHFTIIAIAISPPSDFSWEHVGHAGKNYIRTHKRMGGSSIEQELCLLRQFPLVWNWDSSLLDEEGDEVFQMGQVEGSGIPARATIMSDMARILDELNMSHAIRALVETAALYEILGDRFLPHEERHFHYLRILSQNHQNYKEMKSILIFEGTDLEVGRRDILDLRAMITSNRAHDSDVFDLPHETVTSIMRMISLVPPTNDQSIERLIDLARKIMTDVDENDIRKLFYRKVKPNSPLINLLDIVVQVADKHQP